MGVETGMERGNGGTVGDTAGVPGPAETSAMAEPMPWERTLDLMPPLDPAADAHVHSGFAAGHDSIDRIVTAAGLAGLRQVTFADQVDSETPWLAAYRESVLRAQRRTELDLRISTEVEVIRADGWLGFPPDLAGLDAVTVAVSRLPLGERLVGAAEARKMLAAGTLRATDAVELVVHATIMGVERASRYAPTQLARPLSLLAELGIDDGDIDEALLRECVEGCRVTNTTVEVSEAWHRPSVRLAQMFAASGVALAAASDARYANQVGRWRYVRQLAPQLRLASHA
ncbi:putative hydrolase [Micromonospora pattaloongensis]|uniref:Putative hydrolase n=1 Tax=Micromonospora pattaloongensis TaxID=405436 RepID=A0A1H3N076_9ACTN|nr:hydrolase [Micromonospora pattaloongensis]SDY82246.1 putative hydrolase [Micromonospora pattaloongensis]